MNHGTPPDAPMSSPPGTMRGLVGLWALWAAGALVSLLPLAAHVANVRFFLTPAPNHCVVHVHEHEDNLVALLRSCWGHGEPRIVFDAWMHPAMTYVTAIATLIAGAVLPLWLHRRRLSQLLSRATLISQDAAGESYRTTPLVQLAVPGVDDLARAVMVRFAQRIALALAFAALLAWYWWRAVAPEYSGFVGGWGMASPLASLPFVAFMISLLAIHAPRRRAVYGRLQLVSQILNRLRVRPSAPEESVGNTSEGLSDRNTRGPVDGKASQGERL